jgi:hypothetical protein
MYLARGLRVWLVIMLAESVHGTLRQIFLAPAVGDFTARRIAFFTGMLLIFAIALLLIRWIAAPTVAALFAIGAMWAALTLAFEFGIGYFALGYTRDRLLEDYDVSRGGLMAFGMVYMVFVPYLARRIRGLPARSNS